MHLRLTDEHEGVHAGRSPPAQEIIASAPAAGLQACRLIHIDEHPTGVSYEPRRCRRAVRVDLRPGSEVLAALLA